ncbi:MAG: ferritin family protein [Desulfobacter sp.]|nr:ferritin family protein [Desulfobacter sp.]
MNQLNQDQSNQETANQDQFKQLNILKNAFFMEQQGKTLYETARDKSQDKAVKEFFQDLANEEQAHMEILEKQFKACKNSDKFLPGNYLDPKAENSEPNAITDEVKKNINGAGFEATAVTAAIGFEQQSVELYSLRALEAKDPEEIALYQWLAAWEKTHLKKLISLQEYLMDQIWEDRSFWPF